MKKLMWVCNQALALFGLAVSFEAHQTEYAQVFVGLGILLVSCLLDKVLKF